jgi:hypothetical protein
MLFQTFLPLGLGAALFMMDGINKHDRLSSRQIPITMRQVFIAILRGYLSFVYHCCSFISRYYLIAVPLVMLISPWIAVVAMAMHLIVGSVEFWVRKPSLNLLSFLVFFTLEQISYQSGVWRQCLQQCNFRPLLPRIVHKRI